MPECVTDLIPNCPAKLKGPYDSSGVAVGCKSDCMVDPNPSNSPSCCTGQYSIPSACPPSGVPNYPYFKGRCPRSIVFTYDEPPSTLVCLSSKKPNYTLTFCP